MKEHLSDSEKSALERFVLDEVTREAVRKVILSGIYFDGRLTPGEPADPLKNFMLAYFTTPQAALLPAEEKGHRLEAIINAISLVETGFKEIEKFKPVPSPVTLEKNKAR